MGFYCEECEERIDAGEVIVAMDVRSGFFPDRGLTTTRIPQESPDPPVPDRAHELHRVVETTDVDPDDTSKKTKRARVWYHLPGPS